MSRRAAIAFLVAFLALLIVAMARAGNAIVNTVLEPHHGDGHTRRFGRGMVAFDGAGPERWSFRYRREHRAVRNLAAEVRRQRRLLRRLRGGRTLQSATPTSTTSVPAVICAVFGPYCSQAVAVARCESGLSVYARNGQYENIFQMGYNERRTYGWHTAGSSPWLAARAAYRYFVASGSDWSPWQCKP